MYTIRGIRMKTTDKVADMGNLNKKWWYTCWERIRNSSVRGIDDLSNKGREIAMQAIGIIRSGLKYHPKPQE